MKPYEISDNKWMLWSGSSWELTLNESIAWNRAKDKSLLHLREKVHVFKIEYVGYYEAVPEAKKVVP